MTPERSPFLLGLRAVGLFRVLLALTILWDQLIRLGSWPAFHSTIGLVSLFLPGPALGDRLYAWIGRNRGAIGAAGGFCFGRSGTGTRHGPSGRLVVSLALATVLAWSTVAYPAVRDWKDLRPLAIPLVSLFNLKQCWNMFAPYPLSSDAWHVMPGLARDGTRADVLSGRPIRLDPPRDGPDRYGGYPDFANSAH